MQRCLYHPPLIVVRLISWQWLFVFLLPVGSSWVGSSNRSSSSRNHRTPVIIPSLIRQHHHHHHHRSCCYSAGAAATATGTVQTRPDRLCCCWGGWFYQQQLQSCTMAPLFMVMSESVLAMNDSDADNRNTNNDDNNNNSIDDNDGHNHGLVPLEPASATATIAAIMNKDQASFILAGWDQQYSTLDDQRWKELCETNPDLVRYKQIDVPDAVHVLNQIAALERQQDITHGRCMLGICASSASQGIAVLKSWVSALQLPRGLLHGMDRDGVPIELDGSVYIKYNTGGCFTFADIRKSGMGFDSIWKPGDAMLEQYDGQYRGVYFQVELSDGVFRQYLLPLDTFGEI